jgi:hypothetical protein
MNTQDKKLIKQKAIELTLEYLKKHNLLNAQVIKEVKKLNKKEVE